MEFEVILVNEESDNIKEVKFGQFFIKAVQDFETFIIVDDTCFGNAPLQEGAIDSSIDGDGTESSDDHALGLRCC